MRKRRKRTADLEHWLAGSATPLFILDADRRVTAFNAGCEALTGWSASEIVGQECRYGSTGGDAGALVLASGLCPPPEVFAGAELAAPAVLVHKGGDSLSRLMHYYPLCGDDGSVRGVLGIVLPLEQPRPAPEISPARQLHAELAAARHALRARFGLDSLVAQGLAMRRVLIQIGLAQHSSVAVLLEGETGAGKEHVARVIHFSGPASADWFIPLDCRRLSADELERVWLRLIDTHRPAQRGGSPRPGTVYLADVEFLPRNLQERLVREFAPDDPRETLPLRLLAATSRDLRPLAAADNSLRPDFLALISPLTIRLPALRERGSDLKLLAQHFLEECNRREQKQIGGFDETVWPLFLRYDWPGNLDELAVVVREAHSQSMEPLIRPEDLPFRFRTALGAQERPPPATGPSLPLGDMLTRVETRLIELALERCRGNRTKAAEMLGIHRTRLIRRIEQLRPAGSGPSASAPERLENLAANLMQDEPPAE